MTISIFNKENTEWMTGGSPNLFLGQAPALYDSINLKYPNIFKLYKQQVSQRWVETEFNHEQSRLDMLSCPRNIYEIMLINLSFQWELDSVASRAITPLFAPFVTNSELWAALNENQNMEIIHALSYSDIVRYCVPRPQEVFQLVMKNDQVLGRAEAVVKAFNKLSRAGAEYKLGYRKNDQDTYNVVFMGMFALYCLERIQFMSSFPATFSLGEQGYFQSICKEIQKIMIDELFVHAALDKTVLEIEMQTERGQIALKQMRNELTAIADSVVDAELTFAPYLLGEGRSVVGLTVPLLHDNVFYEAQEPYDLLGLDFKYPRIEKRPLPWMENWIDIDKTQNAMQEADGNNYALNRIYDDLGDRILPFDEPVTNLVGVYP
ncbi:ribonucleotide-diphosphate reductase subunit beta [Ralstonia phage RP13]|nr:ribonucleotide-diphosphate reductase subunit beta [Ralstonia phage RP13]